MPQRIVYQCLNPNCRNRFRMEVLVGIEVKEEQEKGVQLNPIKCPKCGTTQVERDEG